MSDDYPAHQLHPVKTPSSNAVLKGPEGTDVGDLDCELVKTRDGMVTYSVWRPTPEQREMLARGARISLGVWQHPIPPLAVGIEGPFCQKCETYSSTYTEGAFHCPNPDCDVVTVDVNADEALTAEDQVRLDFSPEDETEDDPPDAA